MGHGLGAHTRGIAPGSGRHRPARPGARTRDLRDRGGVQGIDDEGQARLAAGQPATISRGYTYRAPGDADPAAPQTWEVASQLSPAFVSVPQGASVVLSVFIINRDHHEVTLTAPDGQNLLNKVT